MTKRRASPTVSVTVDADVSMDEFDADDLLQELLRRHEQAPGSMAAAWSRLDDADRAKLLASVTEPHLPKPERTLYPDWCAEKFRDLGT